MINQLAKLMAMQKLGNIKPQQPRSNVLPFMGQMIKFGQNPASPSMWQSGQPSQAGQLGQTLSPDQAAHFDELLKNAKTPPPMKDEIQPAILPTQQATIMPFKEQAPDQQQVSIPKNPLFSNLKKRLM